MLLDYCCHWFVTALLRLQYDEPTQQFIHFLLLTRRSSSTDRVVKSKELSFVRLGSLRLTKGLMHARLRFRKQVRVIWEAQDQASSKLIDDVNQFLKFCPGGQHASYQAALDKASAALSRSKWHIPGKCLRFKVPIPLR